MANRSCLLAAATAVAVWSLPATAAQYEKTGHWVFHSTAFAEDGEAMVYACIASTESVEGTELVLRLAPAEAGGVDAAMTLTGADWSLDPGPVRVRIDIGASHWVVPGEGDGQTVALDWSDDAALLVLLEDLASASFAGLAGRGGATVAQFSLKGSRGAIEAMKACAEEQIGRGLAEVFAAGSAGDAGHPF